MRISDWSSDVCSSDLFCHDGPPKRCSAGGPSSVPSLYSEEDGADRICLASLAQKMAEISHFLDDCGRLWKLKWRPEPESNRRIRICSPLRHHSAIGPRRGWPQMCGFWRSEEHTSELQSLMRISYAVF